MRASAERYAAFVRANAPQVKRMEEVARGLAILIPGRTPVSELLREGTYGVVNLAGVVHDHVIERKPLGEPSALRRGARVALTLLQHAEVVLELLAAQVGGGEGRLRAIEQLETLKAALRLLLLATNGGGVLASGGQFVSPRGRGGSAKASAAAGAKQAGTPTTPTTPSGGAAGGLTWSVGRRSGKRVPAAPAGGGSVTAVAPAPAEPGVALVRALGEVMHVLRPVVLVQARRRWGERSWTPFALSAAVDVVSLSLSATAAQAQRPADDGVADELRRRKLLWLLYLLRSPVYDSATLPAADAMCAGIAKVPLVGGLAHYVREYLQYLHKHHFYSSGS